MEPKPKYKCKYIMSDKHRKILAKLNKQRLKEDEQKTGASFTIPTQRDAYKAILLAFFEILFVIGLVCVVIGLLMIYGVIKF
jgi:hypothetical protein